MTNYKQFYNAWQGFAKPKRQLLLEDVGGEKVDVVSERFLFLTTPKKDYDTIQNFIKTKEPKDVLNTKEPEFDIIRRGLRMINDNPNVVDFSKLGTQPAVLKLQKTKQPNIYQVIEHHGRARNFANIYKNNSDLNIKMSVNVVFTDGKSLNEAFRENIQIQAQNHVLDSRSEKQSIIPISQLIPDYNPSATKPITTDDAQKKYLKKLQDLKNQIGSGLNFIRKTFNYGGGKLVKDTFDVNMKLRGMIDQIFSTYKEYRITENPPDNIFIGDAGMKNIHPDALKKIRDDFAEEMNSHLDISNNEDKKFTIISEKLPGGSFAFSLSGAATEEEKDNVIFKTK